ncbi:MAG: thioredoxin family protein [Rhodospirillaceae bacterium]
MRLFGTPTRLAAVLALAFLTMVRPSVAEDMVMPKLSQDGLYHHDWFKESFLDLADDLREASESGKRLVVFFEQVGCIYCKKMQTEVLARKSINDYVRANFDVVQLNLWGSREVTDLDGKAMPEKALARRWGVIFTPTIVFLPEYAKLAEGKSGKDQQVAAMPGAFEGITFKAMFEWVKEKGYEGDEHFQKYVIRKINERRAQ